jgi:hypothetical protein
MIARPMSGIVPDLFVFMFDSDFSDKKLFGGPVIVHKLRFHALLLSPFAVRAVSQTAQPVRGVEAELDSLLKQLTLPEKIDLIVGVDDFYIRDVKHVSDVLKVARELEPFRLLWLENPVPPGNLEALRAVSSRANIPVATGENLFLFAGFREILQAHAVGIATPDVQKVGGCRSLSKLRSSRTNKLFQSLRTTSAAPSAPLRRHIFVRQFQTFCCWNFTLPMYPSGTIWSMVWKDRSSRTDLFISPKSPAWACSSMRKSRESTRARVSRSFNDAMRIVQVVSSGPSM